MYFRKDVGTPGFELAICLESESPLIIMDIDHSTDRRKFLALGMTGAATAVIFRPEAGLGDEPAKTLSVSNKVVLPKTNRKILLSCKLGMIPKKVDAQPGEEGEGKKLTLAGRLALAGAAGFDGVDFDQAGKHTPEEARMAVLESGVFVHNAINHDHWKKRLTSADDEDRKIARENIEHCIRVSHASGGNGVLIVVGSGSDGPEGEIAERCRQEIRSLIPLAASLGQPILFENVWNKMFYDHDKGPDQGAERFVEFVDSFNSPWVGMYYDIGNHWKYGQPGEWIRAFGHRCVKLDMKGFSRAEGKFKDIGEGDLPWDQVRKALDDIGFTGWATAEVGGGGLERLTTVRKQMEKVLGL